MMVRILLLLFMASNYAVAETPRMDLAAVVGSSGLPISVRTMESEAHDPATQCVRLLQRKTLRDLGFLCRSRSRAFLNDMGLEKISSLPVHARPIESEHAKYAIATGMSVHPLEPLRPGPEGVLSATVDCDFGNGPVYRPTSSCRVAMTDPESPEIHYANVLERDHVSGAHGLSRTEFVQLWRSLLAKRVERR